MEDDLQVCRLAANMLNEQSRTADKEWYSRTSDFDIFFGMT
jgi:hypothetical protein